MLIFTLLLPVLLQVGGASTTQADDQTPAEARTDRSLLEEVRADFTVDGKPIHPIILDRFVPPVVGPGPEVLAIDVEAAMHNTAHLPPPVKGDGPPGHLMYRYKDGELSCSASYRIVGMLDDGTVALRSASNYGGTHTTLKLLLVRFDWQFLGPAGEKPRLVMSLAKVADLDLPNRVEVKDHWVEIYPSGRNWPTVISP